MKILFVCMGNICRSPTAEGVVRARLLEAVRKHGSEMDIELEGDTSRIVAEVAQHLGDGRVRAVVPYDNYVFYRRLLAEIVQG